MKRVNIIAACSENLVIGNKGKIPWRIPEDNQFLKEQTLGNIVIIGRRALNEWPSAVKGRQVIVVTKTPEALPDGACAAESLQDALKKAANLDGNEVYVCGGAYLFKEAMLMADRLYLTLVQGDFEGDIFFPSDWKTHFSVLLSSKPGHGEGPIHKFLLFGRGEACQKVS